MTVMTKQNLAGMTREQLRAMFVELDEKPFRAEQVMKWIHQRGVVDIEKWTDISKTLRDRLQVDCRRGIA